MQESKQFILNRNEEHICVVTRTVENSKGLVFLAHGLGSHKEGAHLQTIAKEFTSAQFSVVLFDTTNTFGESDGDYADATVTNYLTDLEDVIFWSKTQTWYVEPFVLVGHSLGAMTTTLFAQKNPKLVKGLAPISPVVAGWLSVAHSDKNEIALWEKQGWMDRGVSSHTGRRKILMWNHMVDRCKYDLLVDAKKINCPVLLIVGEKDTSTPPEEVKMLFNALKCEKEIYVIPDAPHSFKTDKDLESIKKLVAKWLSIHLL